MYAHMQVLVLPKLLCDIPKDLKSILTTHRQTSNVYSNYELLLLEWMNKLYRDDGQSGKTTCTCMYNTSICTVFQVIQKYHHLMLT